jgi:hypothetical protein
MSLLAVAVIALVLSLIPRLGRGGRLARILTEGQNATAQTTGVLPHLLTQSLVPGYDVARTDGSLPAAHCVGASRLELLTPSL